MPTLAIDYTPAIRQSAGIGRIIRGQVQALLDGQQSTPQNNWDVRLFVVGSASDTERQEAPKKLATTPISERNMVRLWHRLNAPLPTVEWFTGGPLDLFHATDFVMAPNNARHKLVTVHDLAFLFYPNAAMPSLHRYLNVVVPRSIQRADHLLADSHNTAADLHREWGIPQESITVVQGAVDHDRFYPISGDDGAMAAAQEAEARVRSRYNIGPEPFILALSTLEPRKNFARLIEAFHMARQEAKLPHRLIIGGKKGWLYDEIFAKVQELAKDAPSLPDAVHFPGFIHDDDLATLYRASEFFAYPSLYEGFGLPIVEAQACGTPVLTATNSCLPEAGGEAAVYVEAESVESIVQGIMELTSDSELRHQLSEGGLAHAAQFTWQRSAEQLIGAYRKFI